jgi:hypothetical protein
VRISKYYYLLLLQQFHPALSASKDPAHHKQNKRIQKSHVIQKADTHACTPSSVTISSKVVLERLDARAAGPVIPILA